MDNYRNGEEKFNVIMGAIDTNITEVNRHGQRL